MTSFDAAGTVARLIDEELSKETVVAADAATIVLERMALEHPAELNVWLRDRAREMLRSEIGHLIRSRRSTARSGSRARAFGEATDSSGGGGLLESWFVVSETYEQKRVADMTGPDHLFVAGGYEATVQSAAMEAAFHRAVAKKVGNKRTGDVLSESQLQRMHKSVTTRAAGRAA